MKLHPKAAGETGRVTNDVIALSVPLQELSYLLKKSFNQTIGLKTSYWLTHSRYHDSCIQRPSLSTHKSL
ncbi:hypothetical protein H6G91_32945 [Nostoc muscorum FACHB-395]|nr:hypothetical protein [Desmonostoc muscorum FACHB-395]